MAQHRATSGQQPEPTESGYPRGKSISGRRSFASPHAFPASAMVHGPADPESLRLDEGIYSNVAVTPGPGGPDVVASRQPYPFITPTFYDRSVGKGYYHAF